MIRWAVPADLPALERVATLDSKRLPAGALLVAIVAGQIWAALSTQDGAAVADPFAPSADLVGLLRTRAAQLQDTGPRRLGLSSALRQVLPRLRVNLE